MDAADGSAGGNGYRRLRDETHRGLLHFLVQARMEPGVRNLIELAPTVQWLQGVPTDEDQATTGRRRPPTPGSPTVDYAAN